MMKFALFAAVALLPFLAFAGDNRCETCGKDLFPAKYSRQCAACIVRESVTEFSDFVRYTDKDMPRVKAERRVRRLGSTAVWTLACYDHRFPIEFVDANGGSHRLDYRLILPVKDNPGRIRIIHSLLGASQQKHFQMKLLAETFMNVNPDIEIEFIYLKSEKDPYLPRIARGNVPSCGEFFWHAAYVERNALLPLDTLDGFEAVCKNLLPALPKGTVYALPSHIGIPNFLLINMKLVEDAGLHLPDPPRTWHQLIRLQRELSGRLGNFAHTTGFPLPDSWHNVKNFAELLGQEIFGGDPDPYSRETFRRLFFTEGAKKGLRILQNLRDGGGVTFNMPHEHFALGKIAILPFASSWDLDLRQFLNAGFPIRCSPMPPVWKSVYRPFYSWFSLGLFREGIHSIAERNAAWSWLKFLLLPSSQQLSSAPSFQLSVLREGMLSFSEEEFPEAHALAVRQFQYAVPQFDFPGIRSAYAEAGAFLREFLLGKYDAEECLQKLRKSIR